jgi:hypothetical protein
LYDKAITLNEFSVQIRYPNNQIFLTNEELETAISITDEFRAIAISLIGIV